LSKDKEWDMKAVIASLGNKKLDDVHELQRIEDKMDKIKSIDRDIYEGEDIILNNTSTIKGNQT